MKAAKEIMKYGLLIDPKYQPKELVGLAQEIEELGYSSFWYPDEKFFRDCYAGLALIASNTKSIKLGPCVTDPFSQNPIQTAQAIASIAEMAPGRTWLGMGAGGRGLRAMGIERNHPGTAIREAVEVIRRLLAGESVDFHGKVIHLNERKLDFSTRADIPIMIATGFGHYIQRLSGEIGDAAMLANYASVETVKKGLRRVQEGAEKAKRSLDELHIILRVDVSVNEDAEQAKRAVSPTILSAIRASYPSLSYLEDLPDFEVTTSFLKILQKKDYQSKEYYSEPNRIAPLIPPALFEHMSIVGSPDMVAEKIHSLSNIDAFDEITLRPIPSGVQQMTETISIIRSLLP